MVIDMYRRNYLFHQYHDNCYPSGKPLMIELPRPGKYRITVTLKTASPLEQVSIDTGAGNLIFIGNIPAGVFQRTAVVNVGNIISDSPRRIDQNREVMVTVTAPDNCFSGLSVNEISCPVIYIAGSGDTSVTRKLLQATYAGYNVAVADYSRPRLTLESFRKEGLYAAINEYIRPGDFCFFQFDPLGQSVDNWSSGGICRRQLARFILECQDRFVYPVLLTPVASHYNDHTDDCFGQLWEQCLDAYREVGKLTVTPVIELHKLRVTPHDIYVTAESAAKEIARICGAYPQRGYRFLAKSL